MRIIAGEFGGRRIAAPPGEGTRPMLDRVREALFATLGERVEGVQVLDLFAGSGSLSLEALSRGATSARLVERDALALETLRANVLQLGLRERARIVRGDAADPRSWQPRAKRDAEPAPRPSYGIVFFDPPYPRLEHPRTRPALLNAAGELLRDWIAPGGVLVFHVPARGTQWVRLAGQAPPEERIYGSSALLYYGRER